VPADAGIRSLPGPGAQSLRGPRRPGPRRRFGLRSQTRIIIRVREPAGGDDGQIRQIRSGNNCGEHRHHELRAGSRNTGTSQHDKPSVCPVELARSVTKDVFEVLLDVTRHPEATAI
jgi:hypothetical protein